MLVDITFDNQYFVLSSNYIFELNVVRNAFTREIPNAWMLKKITDIKNTEHTFVNDYNMVPVGLWLELIKIAKKFNIAMEMTPAAQQFLSQFTLSFEDFQKYIDDIFEGAENENGKQFKPYEYQVKAAYTVLKYKKCCAEISTSGGKTLISFMIFKYLIDVQNIKNILYIVPSVDLANQSAEQYERYESYLKKHNHNWEIGILRAGLTKKQKAKVESCNILFGTFQSLCKRDVSFFNRFEGVILDEAHHGSSNSIKNIFQRMNNLKYSIGVTGTFPKENLYEYLLLQGFIGPVVYKLTANQLINEEKRGTPIYLVFQYMDWASKDEKEALYLLRANKNPDDIQAGNKVLKQERLFVNNSYTRLKFIGDKVISMQKNTLVLFADIKYGYGQKLFEYIKENSDKDVFYTDGNTKTDVRDYYKQRMEEDETGNTVIVASINTFGEGIDIKNLWAIFLVDTAKSDRLVRQICGRGIRLYPGKDKVVLFDFVDDLRYSSDPNKRYKDNYLWKHGQDRKKIYMEQKFPVYEQKINFSKSF